MLHELSFNAEVFRISSYVLLVLVALLVLIYRWYARKPKEPVEEAKPLNRKERRQLEFGEPTEGQIRARRTTSHDGVYCEFIRDIERATQEARKHHSSVSTFTNKILEIADRALVYYQKQAHDELLFGQFATSWHAVVMKVSSQAISEYSGKNGLEAAYHALQVFLEKHYHITSLRSAINIHKGRVHYNDRCEGLSLAILDFFEHELFKYVVITDCRTPFDYLDIDEMTPWDEIQTAFQKHAINKYFMKFLVKFERISYSNQREDSEHHQNKVQRSKRMTRRNRRHKRR